MPRLASTTVCSGWPRAATRCRTGSERSPAAAKHSRLRCGDWAKGPNALPAASACSKRAPGNSPAVWARGAEKSKLLTGGLDRVDRGLQRSGGEGSGLGRLRRRSLPGLFHSAYFILAGLDGSPPAAAQPARLPDQPRPRRHGRADAGDPQRPADQRRGPGNQGPARSRRRRPRAQDRHRGSGGWGCAGRDRRQRCDSRAGPADADRALAGQPARS